MKKIVGKVTTKLFPYWCNYCPKRYKDKDKFEKHWIGCEARLLQQKKEDQALALIAPKNRAERRRMAKKSGLIKEWASLNE